MLADYLHELQHVALLAPAEEAALWHAYRRRGERAARQRLIEAYQPLVFKIVMRLRPPEPLVMDLIQEGLVGLIEAVERFDPERGVRFPTFAAYRIRGRALNALDRARPVLSLDQLAGEDVAALWRLVDPAATSALEDVEDRALAQAAARVLAQLPPRERLVLAAVVGAGEPRQLARDLDISLSHFYRLQKQAVGRLRALLGLHGVHRQQRVPGY
ncbi:MAG: sigma-70 family RNA polymerase sigma factor [Armatimonadota bacterium]|nr:sigma-70 family RNA polymerase sigma factor [Armatimonadota bacterium]